MSITNASLYKLGAARDNSSTNITLRKASTSDLNISLGTTYEVTSISLSLTAGDPSDGQNFTISITLNGPGATFASQLQASGRNNRSPDWSWSYVSGDIIVGSSISSQSNTSAVYNFTTKLGNPSTVQISVTWSDSFNTNRAGTLNVNLNS